MTSFGRAAPLLLAPESSNHKAPNKGIPPEDFLEDPSRSRAGTLLSRGQSGTLRGHCAGADWRYALPGVKRCVCAAYSHATSAVRGRKAFSPSSPKKSPRKSVENPLRPHRRRRTRRIRYSRRADGLALPLIIEPRII